MPKLLAHADSLRVTNSLLAARIDQMNLQAKYLMQDQKKVGPNLKDVRVKLTDAVSGQTTWTSDDDATVTLTLELDLDWSIAVNGSQTPLGTQHLPPVPVDVMLTGAGDHIDASIGLHASGELWNWAGLLELTGLELALSAETTEN